MDECANAIYYMLATECHTMHFDRQCNVVCDEKTSANSIHKLVCSVKQKPHLPAKSANSIAFRTSCLTSAGIHCKQLESIVNSLAASIVMY
jgi:hypothetical protein